MRLRAILLKSTILRPFLAASLVLAAGSAYGAAEDDHVDLIIGRAGTTTLTGNLSTEKAAPTYGAQLEIGRHPKREAVVNEGSWLSRNLDGASISAFLGILSIDTHTASDTKFPFDGDAAVNLQAIEFGYKLCGLTSLPVHACLRIALGNLYVAQGSRNEQSYGGGGFGLGFESFLGDWVFVSGDVEWRSGFQKVAGESSGFGARSQTVGLGIQF
jgi:hypothetical protein